MQIQLRTASASSTLKMNSRAIVIFLALCICISILYASTVYLNANGRRGVVSKVAKYSTDCLKVSTIANESVNGQDVQAVEPLSGEGPFFHPNHNISSSIRPEESGTIAIAAPIHYGRIAGPGVQIPFDPYGTDTIVYMHIQKTGGSVFLEHLVTAQIPLERVKVCNDSGAVPTPNPNSPSPLVQLCQTSPTGGWRRGNGFLHHELCPRDWEHPNGDTWLVSEKTTAWNCGVHAFYTDFKRCLQSSTIFNQRADWEKNKKKVLRLSEHNHFHYVVLLRHPLIRYISEYLHVSRGGCWSRDEEVCRGMRGFSKRDFRCPEHFQCKKSIMEKFSANLTLEKYLRCKDSWSINRMTLMLADHEVATCWNRTKYSREERDRLLLTSAKSNLLNLSYFGLTEFLRDSGTLFEKTFGVVLRNPIQEQPLNSSFAGLFLNSPMLEKDMNITIFTKVIQNNLLDLELYEYALDIFRSRTRTIGKELDTDRLEYIQKLSDTMYKVELL